MRLWTDNLKKLGVHHVQKFDDVSAMSSGHGRAGEGRVVVCVCSFSDVLVVS